MYHVRKFFNIISTDLTLCTNVIRVWVVMSVDENEWAEEKKPAMPQNNTLYLIPVIHHTPINSNYRDRHCQLFSIKSTLTSSKSYYIILKPRS